MLVTVEELSDYMDKLVPTDESKYNGMTMILEGLESELESYLRRPITVGTFVEHFDTTVVAPYLTGGFMNVPVVGPEAISFGFSNTPVTEVLSVYTTGVGGASVVPQGLQRNIDYSITGYGINMFAGLPYGTISVVYRAGLDGPEIKVFRSLILRAASREAQNLYDKNRGLKDMERREVAVQVTGFFPSELESVKRYKRQRI